MSPQEPIGWTNVELLARIAEYGATKDETIFTAITSELSRRSEAEARGRAFLERLAGNDLRFVTEVPVAATTELPVAVTQAPVRFGDHIYRAIRQPDYDGEPLWMVTRGVESTPVGFIQGHRCPFFNGDLRLFVYGTRNNPLFTATPGRDDGCLPSYHNALLAFEVQVPGLPRERCE